MQGLHLLWAPSFRNFFSHKLMLGSCVQQAQNLLFKSSPFQGDYPP
jgi:hypothetical protein